MSLTKHERRALKHKVRNSEESKGRKSINKLNYIVITAIILLVGALGYTSLSGYSVQSGEHDDFAQCLTESGAKFFGAYWCPHCESQKELFGPSIKHINYIECDPNGQNAQTGLCIQNNIQSFPTWEIGGSYYPGVQSLQALSDLTECKL